ncbi:MAG: hypothetical protein N2V72_07710 [Methanophagales archaeon]|nr:hypothetical protein [Methanophagales archaeon]
MGSIDHEGVFTRKKARSRVQESKREVFEYGNGALAYHMIKDLEDILANMPFCNELLAFAIIKAIDPMPLRYNHGYRLYCTIPEERHRVYL